MLSIKKSSQRVRVPWTESEQFVIPLRANNTLHYWKLSISLYWWSSQNKTVIALVISSHVLCLQMTLGHEFGAGAACLKCKDKCEGFELHFWRFVLYSFCQTVKNLHRNKCDGGTSVSAPWLLVSTDIWVITVNEQLLLLKCARGAQHWILRWSCLVAHRRKLVLLGSCQQIKLLFTGQTGQ